MGKMKLQILIIMGMMAWGLIRSGERLLLIKIGVFNAFIL